MIELVLGFAPAARRAAVDRRTALAFTVLLLAALATEATAAAGDWRALTPGRRAEIEGDWSGARGVVADEIDLRDGEASSSVEIVAPIQAVGIEPPTLRVLGVDVRLAANVRIRDEDDRTFDLDALAPGVRVEIDGDWDDDLDRIVAERVRLLAGDGDGDVEIEGPLTGDPASRRVHVAGVPIALTSDTSIRGVRLVARRVDDDEGGEATLAFLGGRLRAGGRFQWKVEPEDNFDLNDARPGDLTEASWSAEAKADVRLHRDLDLYVKGGARGTRVLLDEEQDEKDVVDGTLQQAWAAWQPRARPGIALQVGRQDFDEPREWIWDENLDAIRLHLWTGRVRTEAAVSTRWNVDSARLRDQVNWMALTHVPLADRWEAGAWVLHRRHETDAGERPTWAGVRSMGRLTSRLRHWVDLAHLSGRADGVSVNAWGFDAGARLRLTRAGQLSLTGAWAVGSAGGSDAERFRQTGLQDNNAKFGGVTSFRYYGELLDPELSNLAIATAAVGIRPVSSSSVDVIFHRYAQRVARPRMHGANLDTRPQGLDPDLGTEWDVVVAFEEIPWLDVEYVFAVFTPGDAFAAEATAARFHKLELKLDF